MISIVMAYKNRQTLLFHTLHTINDSAVKDLEIIIVDDASNDNEKISDLSNIFDLDIKVIEIPQKQRTWNNPCIPFNMGFKAAIGDVILMQSPECLHVGDVLAYIKANISNKRYICFSCCAIAKQNMNQLPRSIKKAGEGMRQGGDIWYCHPRFRSWAPHFASAIVRKVLLEEYGGFDERYKDGCDYDDMEFYHRLKISGIEIIVPNPKEAPFVIHQFHESTNKIEDREKEQINSKLYYGTTLKESGWKVN